MKLEIISVNKMRMLIQPLIGLKTCRKQIGYRRSLSIGFGKRIPNPSKKSRNKFYGEWEIMTYDSAWRVIKENKIICASHDASASLTPDDPPDIDKAFRKIQFGRLESIKRKNKWDLEVKFDSGIYIDFFAANSNGDGGNFFVIFCPENKNICIDVNDINNWIYEDDSMF